MSHEKVAAIHHEKESKKLQGLLSHPSNTQVTLGVAAAAGTGLLAASLIGVGPAALAGAAGYLAYRGMTGKTSTPRTDRD
jgi:hypothetical protein